MTASAGRLQENVRSRDVKIEGTLVDSVAKGKQGRTVVLHAEDDTPTAIVAAAHRIREEAKDQPAVFSLPVLPRTPAKYYAASGAVNCDVASDRTKRNIRYASNILASSPIAIDSSVSAACLKKRMCYSDRNGAEWQSGICTCEIVIRASTNSTDGRTVERTQRIAMDAASDATDLTEVRSRATNVIEELASSRAAVEIHSMFRGPVILRGSASPLMVRQALERLRASDMVPPYVKVEVDQRVYSVAGIRMADFKPFGASGASVTPVAVIAGGMVKADVSAVDGPVIVTTSRPQSYAALKAKLMDIASSQGHTYGIVIDDVLVEASGEVVVQGGMRVYVDGHEEQLGPSRVMNSDGFFESIRGMGGQMNVLSGLQGRSLASPDILIVDLEIASLHETPPQGDFPPARATKSRCTEEPLSAGCN